MKVQFINEKEALVTKGMLWWKKQAKAYLSYAMWYHDRELTIPVDGDTLVAIYVAKSRLERDARRAAQETAWTKV